MIWEPYKLVKQGYKINDRKIRDAKEIMAHLPLLGFPNTQLNYDDFLYSGAEHTEKPKLPNITFLPNISYLNGIMLGSTFGHRHTQSEKNDNRRFQEIYEFDEYGAMLIRSQSSAELLLLKPGEKVIIKTDESMTLFNLGYPPLITLDYANPQMNSATKETEKSIGPLMTAWKTTQGILFNINPEYQNNGLISGNKNSVLLRTRILGEGLLRKIQEQQKDFEDCGIKISVGGNIPSDLKQEFLKPLDQLINEQNATLLSILNLQ